MPVTPKPAPTRAPGQARKSGAKTTAKDTARQALDFPPRFQTALGFAELGESKKSVPGAADVLVLPLPAMMDEVAAAAAPSRGPTAPGKAGGRAVDARKTAGGKAIANPEARTAMAHPSAAHFSAPQPAGLDAALSALVATAYALESFTGKAGQTLSLLAPAGASHARLLLVGLGDATQLNPAGWQKAGGAALVALQAMRATGAEVRLPDSGLLVASEAAAQFAFGMALRDYRFDKYLTKQKPEEKPVLARVTLRTAQSAAAQARFSTLQGTAKAVHFARDLVSEPGNILYPETLAEACRQLAPLGVEVEILLPAQLETLGMGSLLGVAQGSVQDARVVVMRYQGAKNKAAQPVAFVGKGVTFDSGGISIKPAGGMEDMKWDMAGSAAVIGTLYSLAARKAKVNAVGVVGLVENMPSGSAQRPGDIVRSMSGQTIEVLNTDAEGRLVLADVLWYTQDRFKPALMVDLATLTGAIIIALGSHKAGLFSNDDALAQQLADSGEEVGESLWRMPLGDAYDRQMDSPVADMQNISNTRDAGSTMGAVFLQRFVNGTPWAHLDIAGTAWSKKDTALCPKGATAFGVRLLDDFVAKHYEK